MKAIIDKDDDINFSYLTCHKRGALYKDIDNKCSCGQPRSEPPVRPTKYEKEMGYHFGKPFGVRLADLLETINNNPKDDERTDVIETIFENE